MARTCTRTFAVYQTEFAAEINVDGKSANT